MSGHTHDDRRVESLLSDPVLLSKFSDMWFGSYSNTYYGDEGGGDKREFKVLMKERMKPLLTAICTDLGIARPTDEMTEKIFNDVGGGNRCFLDCTTFRAMLDAYLRATRDASVEEERSPDATVS
jgi:hypothetical protein